MRTFAKNSRFVGLLIALGACSAPTPDESEVSGTEQEAISWAECANEGGRCTFSGARAVRFGESSSYVYSVAIGGVDCNIATFGDPRPGAAKHCEQASPTWSQCADEGGTCSVTGKAVVRYGLSGRYTYREVTGPVRCDNATFGDPYYGIRKRCWIAQPEADVWTRCADEGASCVFSNAKTVRYGANGKYAYLTRTGGVSCDNRTFGDPLVGVRKACDFAGSADGSGGSGGTGGSIGSGGSGGGGAASGGTGGATGGSSSVDAPSTSRSFSASTNIILNPERGFYTTGYLHTARDLNYVRQQNKSIVYLAAHLDKYLGTNHAQELPQNFLTDIQAGFDAVRRAGLKAIVRFQYDDGEGYPSGANDAPENWMLRHIQQIAPVLQKNTDVIFVLQAGFIGAWGEWHTSQNFADGPSAAGPRKNVFNALLAALPASRTIGLRYPAYKRMFYGTAATTLANLTSGAPIARAGHINDCFVSSNDDVGTYQYEPMETLKTYLAEDTKYVPIGGETCAVHARNSCTTTLSEMSRFHWTYINDDYHGDVLSRWQSEGCRPDMERKLGYRLALTSASLPSAVRPGGSFTLELNIKNEGFAALTNRRPVFVVLEGQGQRLTAELAVDPRTWLPGDHRVTARLRVPSNLATGNYRLALWLPDADNNLRARPEYSIQLANTGTWDSARGDNTLVNISVSTSAPGSSDPAASTFAVIP